MSVLHSFQRRYFYRSDDPSNSVKNSEGGVVSQPESSISHRVTIIQHTCKYNKQNENVHKRQTQWHKRPNLVTTLVSCSNYCTTTKCYTTLLLLPESSSGNVPSHCWPNHSSTVAKWRWECGINSGINSNNNISDSGKINYS